MGTKRVGKLCRYCKKKTMHEKRGLNDAAGLFFTVITGGLFLIPWFVIEAYTPYRCRQCGTKW